MRALKKRAARFLSLTLCVGAVFGAPGGPAILSASAEALNLQPPKSPAAGAALSIPAMAIPSSLDAVLKSVFPAQSPWVPVIEDLPLSFQADFHGLDLSKKQNLGLVARVLDRTGLDPKQIPHNAKSAEIVESMHKALVSHGAGLAVAVQAFPDKPFPDELRADLRTQFDELLCLWAVFPESLREKLSAASLALHAPRLPKAEELAALQELRGRKLSEASAASSQAGGAGKAAHKNGLEKSAPKQANKLSLLEKLMLYFKHEGIDALLDKLEASGSEAESREGVLAALRALPVGQWTKDRQARVQTLFLTAQDAGLRRELAGLLSDAAFGCRRISDLVSALYPEAEAELRRFYPMDDGLGLRRHFKETFFSDPVLFHSWLEHVRRVAPSLPSAEAERQGGKMQEDLRFAHFFFPVDKERASIEGDYELPYPLSADAASREGRTEYVHILQPLPSADSHEKLRRKHALFERLINANFQALETLSSQVGALTRSSAKLLFAQTERLAKLYHRLRGDSPKKAKSSRTQKAYERIVEKLRRRWQGLSSDEPLPENAAKLVLRIDPRQPLRSLHSLINWMHQKALSLSGLDRLSNNDASGFVELEDERLAFHYVGQAPLMEVLRRNQVLRAFFSQIKDVPNLSSDDAFFFDEHRVWLDLSLGCHSAEVFADSSAPDEGGMLRIRFKESGWDGSEYRMLMIATFLKKLGLSVNVENDTYLYAVLDKDRGLDSERSIAHLYPFIVRFLHDTGDMDINLKNVEGEADADGVMKFSAWMGELYSSEGRWPFSNGVDMYDEQVDYLEREPRRQALLSKLDAELARLGLPTMPKDIPFGQRTIDRFFAEPIRAALARGEFLLDRRGAPQRRVDVPLDGLAAAAVHDPQDSAALAAILDSADASLLDYSPIGKVGALSAVQGQKAFEDGSTLAVLALRDDSSGRLAYARALAWAGAGEPRALTSRELLEFLHDQGLSAQAGEALSASQEQRLKTLREAFIPESSPVEQAEAYGLSAAPGKGEFAVGPILFDRTQLQEGAILAVPYTSPDDMEVISRSAGVLSTGGGALSHAAITTRELGLHSVILPSALWRSESGHAVLGVPLARRKASRSMGGLDIAELAADADPYIREGDLVRLYGKEGKLALIARKGDAGMQEAYAALEALRSGEAAELPWKLDWTEKEERFLLEEARSDSRYSRETARILEALRSNAKHLPPFALLPQSSSDPVNKAPLPHSARMFWSRLESRLKSAQDPGKKARLLELLRRLLRRVRAGTKQGMDVLYICAGNTCRSPMAEQITQNLLSLGGPQDIRVTSRGLSEPFPGEGMTPQAGQALSRLGIPPRPHTTRMLTEQDVRSADIILTMSELLAGIVIKSHPEAAPKVALLNRFAGLGDKPITDPMAGPMMPYSLPDRGFAAFSALPGRDALPAIEPSDGYDAAAKDILAAVWKSIPRWWSFLNLKAIDSEVRARKLREAEEKEPSFLDLADIDDDLKPLVGGKSAKLGEMLQALSSSADDSSAVSASVPEGLALTIYAYKRFLNETGLEDKVRALAMELDVLLNAPGPAGMDEVGRSKEVDRLSERIRQVLMSAKLDPENGVGRDILQALQKHGFSDPAARWSVRSSAIQEDSDDAAFAGAAESYLNLKPEEVLDKVVENWASFWLPRGILYRQRQGLRSADLLPATLIQKMAPAAISGVIFTRNPVNGQDEVVINAAYGLGEGVVSGQAAADMYVTRKWDGQESELPHVARKRWQVEARPEGFGTRLGPVAAQLRGLRVLTREQTSRLTRVAVSLEKRFGRAMDIEFSLLADGTIVVLQARPITTR
ncbi:MAG: PEP/pyruvate-binding domain-containing protein [Elusimicrobiota bacterium]|jgi:protein-tyrosine-phosphatase/phosphohistidine swiveling domain-containing protein